MSINVHTEWGKLKEIVVGSCVNLSDHGVDASFKLFFHENITDSLLKNSVSLQRKLVEQRQEDLDGIADTLSKMGVVVKRPRKLEKTARFKTPEFEASLRPVDNPRDQTLIVGDEIIETSCQWRERYFENDLLKDVFLEYFKKGARWTAAPRPIMGLDSFDFSKLDRRDPAVDWKNYSGDPGKFEIMFDGAQCLKFGKDLVMNVSTANHELGAAWLRRHLEGRFRVHVARITDHHLDGMFMPLRPGVLLLNPVSMPAKVSLLPEPLQRWDHVIVPEAHDEESAREGVLLASQNINVNVLPLSPTDVMVFDPKGSRDTPLIRALEKKDFNAIPVRLRHSRIFGGGLHCATLDTVREDSAEDYFG